MLYIYPVIQSAYPTWFVETLKESPITGTEESASEVAVTDSERSYEEWDDGLNHNIDISI